MRPSPLGEAGRGLSPMPLRWPIQQHAMPDAAACVDQRTALSLTEDAPLPPGGGREGAFNPCRCVGQYSSMRCLMQRHALTNAPRCPRQRMRPSPLGEAGRGLSTQTEKARTQRIAPPWVLAYHYIKMKFSGLSCRLSTSYREIAPLGQASAQVPHSVHSSGLIEYFSPSEIAPTGHSSIHVPHATQSSPITYAIIYKFFLVK